MKGWVWVGLACLVFAAGVAAAECGNGSCESGETKCSCPADCGVCSGDVSGKACFVFACAGNTCQETVKLGCCGNGLCEASESYLGCPADCAPRSVRVEGVPSEAGFLRGESLVITAKVFADENPARGNADVWAEGFFGRATLRDDGLNEDGEANDGVYGGTVLLGGDAPEGEHEVQVTAIVLNVGGKDHFGVAVSPYLELEASLERDAISLGDRVSLKGSVRKQGKAAEVPVKVSVWHAGNVVLEESFYSDDLGEFVYSRRTSLLDPLGDWLVEAYAEDASKNYGRVELPLRVFKPGEENFLSVRFLEPAQKSAERGGTVQFLLEVVDEAGLPLEAADVSLEIGNLDIEAAELAAGRYGAKWRVPTDFRLGENTVKALADKNVDGKLLSGFREERLLVHKAKVFVNVESPKKQTFRRGERIAFRVRAMYSFDEPVEGALVEVLLNGKLLHAKSLGEGVYEYVYSETREGVEFVEARLKVVDAFDNQGEASVTVKVLPEYALEYLAMENLPVTVAVGVGAAVTLLALAGIASRQARALVLNRRKNKLTKLKRELQQQYFNEQTVSNAQYRELAEKYGEQLDEVEAALSNLKEEGGLLARLRKRFGH